ncbi:MAG: trigger factor, partial [Clostridia bacterium]
RYVDVAGRECKDGDAVVIDFSGKVDGKIFEGGTAKDYRLELGSHTFIEGFEEQVCGMKIDEEKDVNVSFPESYPVAELAGKPAVFAVKLHKIEGKELPELNDEFASSVSECETLEEYQNSVKTQLEASLAIKIERETENKIIEAIVASSSIDVPKIMIEKQLDMFVQDLEMRLSYQGIKLEDYVKYSNTTVEKIREERKAQAEISVKTRLVLEEIIKKENLFVTAGEINDKVSEMAAKYKKSLDEYKKQLGDKQLSYIENEVLMNKVVAFLKSKNEII